jgi:hypothetical protein
LPNRQIDQRRGKWAVPTMLGNAPLRCLKQPDLLQTHVA